MGEATQPDLARTAELSRSDRLIVLEADAMGRLRKELIWTLGIQRARAVMTRFGYAMGYSEAVRCRDISEDDDAWLRRAPEALTANRLARVEPTLAVFDRPEGTFEYRCTVSESFEVVEHSGHLGANSTKESCWILVGYLSGYASAFLGGEVYFDETQCAIAGQKHCLLVGRSSEQWSSEQASRLASLYEEENVGNELTVVYDELSHKNDELQQAIGILRAQQEATPDGMLVVDSSGKVLSCNRRFLRIWSIPDEMAGRLDLTALLQIAHARVKDPEAFIEHVRHFDANPEESGDERVIEFQDGTVLSLTTVPVKRDDGHLIGRAWYSRDISAQRKLEEDFRQSQKMEAIGTLAGGVAHDFNNLLTAIGGHITLALPALPAESPQRHGLKIAERAVDRAGELTRALLNFSRQTAVRTRAIDLADVIAETVKLLRRTIDPRIEISTECGDDLGLICADAGQIQQVLTNLCVNARDAMPQGGTLLITAANGPAPQSGGTGTVLLNVADTGIGMSADVKARIFDPFFTTKGIGEGTGLGLATVYGIVQQHGATIDCESLPGAGTTFRVVFPRTAILAGIIPAAVEAQARGGRETILVVDDEEVLRGLERRVLESYGYKVLTAADGREAAEVFAANVVDVKLVLLDLLMPRRSGKEAFLEIRAANPTVPVLIVTGYSAPSIVDELLAFRGTSLLEKPFKPAVLARRIREMLDGLAFAAI